MYLPRRFLRGFRRRKCRLKSGHVEVRERDGQRIGRIGPGRSTEAQDRRHDHRDLAFVRGSATRHRTLDERRRIFAGLERRTREPQEHDTARVTELRCTLRILREKDALYGSHRGRMLGDDLREAIVDVDETIGKRAIEIHVDDTVRNMLDAAAFTVQDAPTKMSTSRIDAKNAHAASLADAMSAARENFVWVQKVFRIEHALDVALQLNELR